MLIKLMKECNNYFFVFKIISAFKIDEEDNIIINKAIEECKKVNSITINADFNNGTYLVNEVNVDDINNKTVIKLKDFESLVNVDEGTIYFSFVPISFRNLANEIKETILNNDVLKVEKNVIISESLGEYSYTKATNKNGELITWRDLYKDDLKKYRKLFPGYEYVRELEV